MDPEYTPWPADAERHGRVGFLGVFTSRAVEDACRWRHFRDDRWLGCFLVMAGMLRVAALALVDFQHFGVGPALWPLLAGRVLFLVVSAWTLRALRRTRSPVAADRLFFAWCFLLVATTVCALAARPPDSAGLLMMSFVMVLVAYCVTPLPLACQAVLALSYSALALFVSRRVDGESLAVAGLAHVMANLFGAVVSWRLNHRRREAFLGTLREARLRAGLEEALAEIKTLRGLLCICAWCKRVRDEEAWEPVETYVQNRTEAAFTHGICPDCLDSQMSELARQRAR